MRYKNLLIIVLLIVILFAFNETVFSAATDVGGIVKKVTSGNNSGNLSITKMMANLKGTWQSLGKMGSTFAYVAGVYFGGLALHKMAKMGQPGQQGVSINSVVLCLISSVCLISMPFLVESMGSTLGVGGKVMIGKSNSMFENFSQHISSSGYSVAAFESVVMLIQLVGWFAVIRSFLLLKAMGASQGGNQVGLAKVLLHFIPGVMLMYILEVSDLFLRTVTITS